jgi:hypothetical protein
MIVRYAAGILKDIYRSRKDLERPLPETEVILPSEAESPLRHS